MPAQPSPSRADWIEKIMTIVRTLPDDALERVIAELEAEMEQMLQQGYVPDAQLPPESRQTDNDDKQPGGER